VTAHASGRYFGFLIGGDADLGLDWATDEDDVDRTVALLRTAQLARG